MEKNYIKECEDGKVKVVEINTVEKVKSLYEMKQRKAELERDIKGRRDLFVAQKAYELEQAGKVVDAQIAAMQTELDELNIDIAGAEAAGVVEVIPPPVEPPAEPVEPPKEPHYEDDLH